MDNNRNSFSAKKVALSGILIALSVISLFLATIMPTNRISLYALSSFFIAVVIIEYGIKTGWAFYIASNLLAFIIVQVKIRLIPYIVFFGIYGIIKYYIEKIDNIVIEYVLKILYFNVSLASAALIAREFFLEGMNVKLPWWLLIIALEIVFVIYDYVYTLFIQYYRQKLKKMLKI